ncbi:NIPSNAP family protein [Streptomyces griseoluteus]|uniref:NIPSNAP family protein n=1 Tax=Streptomyces griseoluteus TaxID=29306 RepID=UPI0038270876
MSTCVVRYTIDPRKIAAFERFGRRWMELVQAHGGVHHGYFLPAEGASDEALALFTFPGLAAYEEYRQLFGRDPAFIEAGRAESGQPPSRVAVLEKLSCQAALAPESPIR